MIVKRMAREAENESKPEVEKEAVPEKVEGEEGKEEVINDVLSDQGSELDDDLFSIKDIRNCFIKCSFRYY